jgi:2-polyprenyl-6-methoxyphenol hydroxylase-like FAD-dependent oxidoreductase
VESYQDGTVANTGWEARLGGDAGLWLADLSAYIGEPMADTLQVQCCIAGGGPAGMMLGFLLGRAGVKTVVLEKHADFLRDFRGDTVHPSTLMIMHELGLIDDFLKLPHSEIRALSAEIGDTSLKIADFAYVPAPCKFVALMPQWDFLNFLADKGRRFPALKVMMSAQVTSLIEDADRVVGVKVTTPDGPLEVRADLVVATGAIRRCARRRVSWCRT